MAGKTVLSHCYTGAMISERFRDKGLIIKRYINSSVYFTLLTTLTLDKSFTPMCLCHQALVVLTQGADALWLGLANSNGSRSSGL